MRDRMYRGDAILGRSLSPRHPAPSSRDYSPRSRSGAEKYSRDAVRSLRNEKNAHFDRNSNLRVGRFPNYDDRGRDRSRPAARHSRSPRRIEKRDHYERDASMRTARFSDYDGGGKDRVREEFGYSDITRGAGEREYYPQSRNSDGLSARRSRSPHRIKRRGHFGSDTNMRPVRPSDYDGGCEDKVRDAVHYVDSPLAKSQWDNLLDGPKKSVNVNDDNYASDYYVVGDSNTTRGGGGKDYYPRRPYSNGRRLEMFSPSNTTPILLDYERGGTMHTDSFALSSGGINPGSLAGGEGGSRPFVASRYLNSDNDKLGYVQQRDELQLGKRGGAYSDNEHHFEKKDSDFHFHNDLNLDKLGTERPVGREIYKYDNDDSLPSLQFNLKGESDYFHSLSKYKGYVSSGHLGDSVPAYSTMRDIHMPSHPAPLGSEIIGTVGIFEKLPSISPRRTGPPDDLRAHSRSYLARPVEKYGNNLYSEFGRSKTHSTSTVPKYVGEEYRDHKMSRIGVLDPIVGKPTPQKHIGDDGLWDPYSSTQGPSRKRDLDMLGSGSSDLNGGSEAYLGYGIRKHGERHTEVGGGSWSFSERSGVRSREYDSSYGRLCDSPRKELSLIESSERRLKDQHVTDKSVFSHGAGIRISSDGNGARTIYRQEDGRDEMDLVSLSKKPKLSKSNYEKTRRGLYEIDSYRPFSEKSIPSHPSNVRGSHSRDIKRRLGPVPQKLHVSQRLVDKHKPSIKKRLGPAAPKKHPTLPWIKNLSSNRMPSIQDGSDGSPHDLVRDYLADADYLPRHESSVKSEDIKQLPKHEPPVKSEDFKQLVQSAFFKFLKQINETPAKRKKYLEQGKVGNLKCIVCGSNSDEFVDAESLAVHTFTSEKVGLRSQHLGLHKALCVLNGWKIAEVPSSVWHPEAISSNEIKALKEDLIIWPPVVVLHNSTIDNKNPDERVVVPAEKLEMKIRGMGIGNILKVCCSKPANQSVMVVMFNGTLSGLQQAEKLHKNYIGTQHGRVEFEQVKSTSSKSGESSSGGGTEADNEETIFYGYLGIAEDLDKLDFDTKKRCVLRSKKEILSIA